MNINMETNMDLNKFAMEWISSWNSHDLNYILSHYSEDIEITTPMIKIATGGTVDSLKGKVKVKEYWQKALEKIPDLHFEFVDVSFGVNSVVIYYKSILNKMSMEVMFFNDEGKVNRVYAHYTDIINVTYRLLTKPYIVENNDY